MIKTSDNPCVASSIFHYDADPDLTVRSDADPDLTFQFDADPDPTSHSSPELDPAPNYPPRLPPLMRMRIRVQLSTLMRIRIWAPRVSSALSFIAGVHIGARALHVLICDMVWLNRSPIPVGRRGVP
jgi:hypothetical protein